MVGHRRDDVRRDRDGTCACGGLRGADDRFPCTHDTARSTRTVRSTISMSRLRSSRISPLRRAHHAPRWTMVRNCSGTAPTITASSSIEAGRMSRARGALDAPRIRHGLAVMRSSATAVFMIALSTV